MQYKNPSFHQIFTLSLGVVISAAGFSTQTLAQSNPGFSFMRRDNTLQKTVVPNRPSVEPEKKTTHQDKTPKLTIQQNPTRQTTIQPLNTDDQIRNEPSNTITFPDYYQPR